MTLFGYLLWIFAYLHQMFLCFYERREIRFTHAFGEQKIGKASGIPMYLAQEVFQSVEIVLQTVLRCIVLESLAANRILILNIVLTQYRKRIQKCLKKATCKPKQPSIPLQLNVVLRNANNIRQVQSLVLSTHSMKCLLESRACQTPCMIPLPS